MQIKENKEDYEFLKMIGRVVQEKLCKNRQISQESIDEWDKSFEEARAMFPTIFGETNSGDHPKAPYHNEHLFASRVEQSIAMELGINWEEYSKTVEAI